uniref:Uncharacterized protein AlNc14C8G1055 n=1 Tax=Albugo laibachii Nc14 TaxID=890382 RepID=F0W1X6_9STRA|nr:conserved hypothetical protein [Albugo laibachii Nc14]|eukprot:CCA15055.1 conserved hypothetical protein [Albugo laibachii Nc14]
MVWTMKSVSLDEISGYTEVDQLARSRLDASMAENTTTPAWPIEANVASWYQDERADVDDVIANANDLDVWTLDSRRENTTTYFHCKNNERLSYAVRAVTIVQGNVPDVLESMRANESARFRHFMKAMHPRNYIDGEVLYDHSMTSAPAQQTFGLTDESITLKWFAVNSGNRLSRNKEFLVRSYCAIHRQHPIYGQVGVCRLSSYDGIGAKYGFRVKQDTYSLYVFEPSSIVVQPSTEGGCVRVTCTYAVRKARGDNTLSNSVKFLATRLCHDIRNFQRAIQSTAQFLALAQKNDWVQDVDRSKCRNCLQSFSILKRRHHCRVCGEVLCASCTSFKVMHLDGLKVRVCKECVSKSSRTDNPDDTGNSHRVVQGDRSGSACGSDSSSAGYEDPIQQTYELGEDDRFITQNSIGKFLKLSTSSTSTRTVTSEQGTIHDNGSISSPTSSIYKSTSFNEFHSQRSRSRTESIDEMGFTSLDESPENPATVAPPSRRPTRKIHYFNEDLDQICSLAMEALSCPIAGIRTDDFELVRYNSGGDRPTANLPRSLPTFRRMATKGKPCIVLNVAGDQRIAGEKRKSAKLQFFIGIPLMIHGEVVGDLCIGDSMPRQDVSGQQLAILKVLGETSTRYMRSNEFMDDLSVYRRLNASSRASNLSDIETRSVSQFSVREDDVSFNLAQPLQMKEIAF